MTGTGPRPPRLALWLLRAARLRDQRDDVEADLFELFAARAAARNVSYARRRFWLDVTSVWLRARRSAHAAPRSAGWPFAGLRSDLIYAVRLGRRSPTPVIAACLCLGLAIGVGTAVFSLLNGTWLRSYLAADEALVKVWREHATGASMHWPASEFVELRQLSKAVTLEGWALRRLPFATAETGNEDEVLDVHFVTGGYLASVGPRASAGRLLEADDDRPRAAAMAVVSHLFWRRRLAADPSIVGRPVWIGKARFVVVGIAGRDFLDPSGAQPSFWVPLNARDRVAGPTTGSPASAPVMAIGRLRPDVSRDQGEAELTRLVTTIAPARAPTPRATSVGLQPTVTPEETAQTRLLLVTVLSVVGLVLLLACANVSNLLLAGAASRQREMGVRLALGAGRWRVVRQLTTESLLLSGVAAGLGLLFAVWLAPALAVFMGMAGSDVEPDARVYAFLLVAVAICGLGAALAPARYGSRADFGSCLNGGRSPAGKNPGPGRVRSILVGTQAAASVVLAVLAALFVRALVHITWQDPGFDVHHLLSVSAEFNPNPRTPADEARAADYWTAALGRVRTIPAVEQAALAQYPPFGISVGDPDDKYFNQTDAGYFETAGIRVVRGRTYTNTEVAGREPVAVISEQVARQFWGAEDPIGDSLARVEKRSSHLRIIGIVADAITVELRERRTPVVYVPMTSPGWTRIVIRANDPRAVAGQVREALRGVTPGVSPTVSIIADRFAREFERPRRLASLAMGIGLLALGLSVVGLYGVTAFVVGNRMREVGIRMALGARPGAVTRELMRDSLRPVVIGLVVGLVAALFAGQVIAALLYGVGARDPIAVAFAVLVLLASAAAAVFVPARRGARLNPAALLRDS